MGYYEVLPLGVHSESQEVRVDFHQFSSQLHLFFKSCHDLLPQVFHLNIPLLGVEPDFRRTRPVVFHLSLEARNLVS